MVFFSLMPEDKLPPSGKHGRFELIYFIRRSSILADKPYGSTQRWQSIFINLSHLAGFDALQQRIETRRYAVV